MASAESSSVMAASERPAPAKPAPRRAAKAHGKTLARPAVKQQRTAHRAAHEPAIERHDEAERATLLLAAAVKHARNGQTQAAERAAAQAMTANPLDPEPHVLLAALFAARDAFKQAEGALRRALFLDPACIPALWQMGTLYRLTNRDRQAAYTFARLLARLEGLPPDQQALPFDNLNVHELTTLLRAALGEPTDA